MADGRRNNKGTIGNNGGRPPIHTDPEEVQRLIDDYFIYIQGEEGEREKTTTDTENGTTTTEIETYWIRRPEPPTITGLTLALNFASKTSLYEYAEKDQFMNPIKRAITKIEQFHEIQAAYGDKCAGNIFVLKNFGWTDRTEIEHHVHQEQPLYPDDVSKDNSD